MKHWLSLFQGAFAGMASTTIWYGDWGLSTVAFALSALCGIASETAR